MTPIRLQHSLSYAIIAREVHAGLRQWQSICQPLLFFLIVISMFAIAVGRQPSLWQAFLPAGIWIAALLATLFASDGIFKREAEDGALEQWVLSPHALSGLVLMKVGAHWLLSGLPLIALAMGLAIVFALPPATYATLLGSLLLGTPILSFIGALGAALTVQVRQSGLLLTVIIIPLYLPVLIFGSAALQAALQITTTRAPLYLLAAMLLICLAFAPFAIAAALKINLSE